MNESIKINFHPVTYKKEATQTEHKNLFYLAEIRTALKIIYLEANRLYR